LIKKLSSEKIPRYATKVIFFGIIRGGKVNTSILFRREQRTIQMIGENIMIIKSIARINHVMFKTVVFL